MGAGAAVVCTGGRLRDARVIANAAPARIASAASMINSFLVLHRSRMTQGMFAQDGARLGRFAEPLRVSAGLGMVLARISAGSVTVPPASWPI